jgi:DNA-binding NarL/FixJ family response regulator
MPASKRIRLLVIEDNRLLREGIVAMVAGQKDISVIATSGNHDALRAVTRARPDVVLLDLGLRGHNSLRIVQGVRESVPSAKIVIMDLVPIQEELVDFVEAGVSGFILKDATFDDFVTTIRSVARGTKVLPTEMTDSLFTQIVEQATRTKKASDAFRAVRMTRREREVIEQIAEGLSNKEIARQLNIAVHTVKSHVHNILEKLALHTRLEIATYAHRTNKPDQKRP